MKPKMKTTDKKLTTIYTVWIKVVNTKQNHAEVHETCSKNFTNFNKVKTFINRYINSDDLSIKCEIEIEKVSAE